MSNRQTNASTTTCHRHKPYYGRKPMDEIGMELFEAIGKKWLATVDRYSGYAWL